jgi:hypothetical protein
MLIAALVDAADTASDVFDAGVVATVTGIPWFVVFVGFSLVYDGLCGFLLYRKIARCRRAYDGTAAEAGDAPPVERTEFDG